MRTSCYPQYAVLQKDSSLQIEITTLHALPLTVSAPDLPDPQSSSDNHLYGDPEHPWDAYIQSWNSNWTPIPIANPP
jgi:hypothetical protein